MNAIDNQALDPADLDAANDITNADGIAADYVTTKPTVLSWWHKGIIPAAAAHGRVIRFSRKAVAQALAVAAKPATANRGGSR
jgi:hypothetical protein